MLVKVCGMRDADNVSRLLDLKPDFMGMIFWPKSSRFVNPEVDNDPILTSPFSETMKVGVFVNQAVDEILKIADLYSLDYVQLHGNESPDFCERIARRSLKIIKAFGISERKDLEQLSMYSDIVDMFVLDTKTVGFGGSGKQFDWSILTDFQVSKPFLLSGGIGPTDIETVKNIAFPNMLGIDLNSKFEISPAMKNIELLKTTISKIRKGKDN